MLAPCIYTLGSAGRIFREQGLWYAGVIETEAQLELA